MGLNTAFFSLFEPVPKNAVLINALFLAGGFSELLFYYCPSTVLLYSTRPLVDCGGECRLEAKVFKMKGFFVLVVILE